MKKSISLENMTDVVAGKLNLLNINREIIHYMKKSPKRLVVDIQRNEENGGYYTSIYIPIKIFKEKC